MIHLKYFRRTVLRRSNIMGSMCLHYGNKGQKKENLLYTRDLHNKHNLYTYVVIIRKLET